ncbi:MAG: HNH endonuclease [Oscillospiraceae bacterium]|jgi:5-methylcytosine-specific restriction protein A|nr:HNH endonuclease [Oscillospiraceae bacterium]
MPMRPSKACGFPGCPNPAEGRYCPEHKALEARRYNQTRRPDVWKTYGRRWEKIRNLYISKHPLCELCLQSGRLVPAEEVHHLVPTEDGGGHAESNLQALCKPCHTRITFAAAREKSG